AAGTPAPAADAPRWSGRPGDDRAAQITARPGTEVVAVQDGTIIGTGHNDAMGHWVRLRDVFGNRYTYAHLGSVADTYAAPESTEAEEAAAAAAEREEQRDPAPDGPATAGSQPALDAIAAMQSGSAKAVTPAPGSPLLAEPQAPGGSNGATTPAAHEADETRVPKGYGVPVPPAGPNDPAAAAAPAGGSVSASAPAAAPTATPAAASSAPASPVARAAAPTPGTATGAPSTPAPATGIATPVGATPATAPSLGALPVPGAASPASPLAASSSILAPTSLPSPDVVLAAIWADTPSTSTVLARGPLSTRPAPRGTGTRWAGVPSIPAAASSVPAASAATASTTTSASAPASASTSTTASKSTKTDDEQASGSSGHAPRIVLKDLRTGARVNGGTVLGTIGREPRKGQDADGKTASMAFGVRPAGKGAPRVDPRPLLDGWRLLSATAERESAERDAGEKKSALFGIRAGSATAGQVLLLGKEQLQARVLADDRIEIPTVGRAQIRAGLIDRRVLATLAYLSANGHDLRISSLRRPGSITTSGNLSEHDSGNAVDIAAVDGQVISPKTQGAGSITDRTVRLLLRLQGTMTPHQIITLMGPDDFGGATNVLAMGDHDDHIHVGFAVAGGDGAAAGGQLASALKPGQWDDLVERLGKIENPQVATKASRFALKVRR
ncbi:MAG: hypothetical protein Q7T67_01625, partial [Patulibacter sp.]|nr:hypothetical protein [Patulibacter sp.]